MWYVPEFIVAFISHVDVPFYFQMPKVELSGELVDQDKEVEQGREKQERSLD